MPWSDKNGGGWKSGGGRGDGPWGQKPSGGGGPGGNQPPDIEEMLKKGQDKLKQAMPGGGMNKSFLFLVSAIALAAIAFFGFTVRVNPDEVGVVLRFGKFHDQLAPGLNFRYPYPIDKIYLPKVTRINRTSVGFRGGSSSRFGNSSGDVAKESLMLTGDENIVDVDFVVFWQVGNAKDFLFEIQNPVSTVKEVAESAMREIVGQNDIEPILTERRAKTELAVLDLMQKTLKQYKSGIRITQVQMQKVDPPGDVIGAFRDVQAARADQDRLKNESETYANRVIPEARGEAQKIAQEAQAYKEQTIAQAEGQADRFVKIYNEYAKAPEVTRKRMFLETMEKVLGRSEKIIIDNKGGGTGVVPYLPLNELTRKRGGGQ